MDNLNLSLIHSELENFKKSDDNTKLQKIQKMKNELQESIKKREEYEDPDNILYKNIDRANRMLDILEEKIKEKAYFVEDEPKDDTEDGDKKKKKKTSDSLARLFEVTALLLNTITTATNSIAGSFKDDLDYQYKLEMLTLEKQKLAVKFAMSGIKGGEIDKDSDVINLNREELLEMMDKEKGDE